MDSIDTLVFLTVAKTLSFKESGDQLGMSRSAVSRRISHLEKELETALLNRTPRSVSLTEAGQMFAGHCQQVEDLLNRAKVSVQGYDQQATGVLRTSISTGLGAQLMPDLMTDFASAYPDIRIVAGFGEPLVDIVKGGFDVVIRVAERLTDSALMAKRLASSPRVLVASPDYLRTSGTPLTFDELEQHRCLGLGVRAETSSLWRFLDERNHPVDIPVEHYFTANNDLALILAACLGAGLFYTTEILVQNELKRGRLVKVLEEECQRITMGVFAVYPQKQPSAKVRAFIDFVEQRLRRIENQDRWQPLKDSGDDSEPLGANGADTARANLRGVR